MKVPYNIPIHFFFGKPRVTQSDKIYFSVYIADILYESCYVNLLFSLLNNICLYSFTSPNDVIVVYVQIMDLCVLKTCAIHVVDE